MNRLIRFIPLVLISWSINSAVGLEIKSLRVYSSNDQVEFPVIDYSNDQRTSITIDFDVQSSDMPNLSIVFKFCDENWNPYNNAFLSNRMYSTETILWFERLPQNIRGARYHYNGSFPNNNVNFPFSGKWKFFIVDSQNRDLVYATGNFMWYIPKLN